MAKMLLASFKDPDKVSDVVDDLEDEGYDKDQISLVTSSAAVVREEYGGGENKTKQQEVMEDAGAGAAIGGLAGLLLSVLGIFIVGPISLALGLAGIFAGTTVTGIIVGAVAGGLVGYFTELGVPEDTAERYEEVVYAGGAVVGVTVDDLSGAQGVFDDANANDITEIEVEIEK